MNAGNRKAFLDMLAWSEGTSTVTDSDNGYNVLVGGALFTGYADHPRIKVDLGHGLISTAAGRYQLLERFFDAYKATLLLPDFSPESQDEIALQQIVESGALSDIDTGDIWSAVRKCAHIWASLPGNTYGQHTNPMAKLIFIYAENGGLLAPSQQSTIAT